MSTKQTNNFLVTLKFFTQNRVNFVQKLQFGFRFEFAMNKATQRELTVFLPAGVAWIGRLNNGVSQNQTIWLSMCEMNANIMRFLKLYLVVIT